MGKNLEQALSADDLFAKLQTLRLLGVDSSTLYARSRQRQHQLYAFQQAAQSDRPIILLTEPNPLEFLAGLIAALSTESIVILGNPAWRDREWQQVFRQVQPDLIWGTLSSPIPSQPFSHPQTPSGLASNALEPNWILIPTGGSSGIIRFSIHTIDTLTAAVHGFQDYFQVEQIHSFCVLPLCHVSGLMQFWRSFLTGGKLAIYSYSELFTTLAIECSAETASGVAEKNMARSNHQFASLHQQLLHDIPQNDPFFLSLVPTQLQRLMAKASGCHWLKLFSTIFLGGAPSWLELLKTARSHHLRIAPTYGMTETAGQVATLKPDDFLKGKPGCGQVLPHAAIDFQDQKIAIRSNALMLGYFPKKEYGRKPIEQFLTDDCGYFDDQGSLHITGRSSQKIITGGENVFPIEVETAVRLTKLVADICVIGMPDQTWGEAIVAVYVPISPQITVADLKSAIAPLLSRFKQPKHWICLDHIPRNAQGKVNYAQLKQFLECSQTQTPPPLQTAPLADVEPEKQLNWQ
ncbi:MAG: 2-succinylbenzoate--CoA ligase [Elainella sp. Prado103]|jgi:O-succinylbenzoic acid--CoA ligase|nr:2-succinylbenzoate--CoA ligase [Elainella sp. Prado103]